MKCENVYALDYKRSGFIFMPLWATKFCQKNKRYVTSIRDLRVIRVQEKYYNFYNFSNCYSYKSGKTTIFGQKNC